MKVTFEKVITKRRVGEKIMEHWGKGLPGHGRHCEIVMKGEERVREQ